MRSHRTAGITSNTVPWEILRAAGYAPVLLEEEAGPTPHADRWMEDVFDRRFRVIFDRLWAGAWNHLDRVVIPRTSEQEHKLYLYLREIARTQAAGAIPELYFYNLLHTRTPESYDYGLVRTRQMICDFNVSEDELCAAIAESNRARGCVRDILGKRKEGRLEGSTALEWIRGFYAEDRGVYAGRILERLKEVQEPVAGNRPHILIKGAPLKDTSLHRRIEEAGGYVIAEDDWRGSRAAGDTDVCVNKNPATAIFEKYFYDEVSPRVYPSQDRDAWFRREIERGDVNGVIFYVPLEDDVFGWDYPGQLAFLKSRRIPSVVIRETGAPLAAFVESLRRK
jgi:2-hydroxyglutaryl-CoA dehydratase, D-component